MASAPTRLPRWTCGRSTIGSWSPESLPPSGGPEPRIAPKRRRRLDAASPPSSSARPTRTAYCLPRSERVARTFSCARTCFGWPAGPPRRGADRRSRKRSAGPRPVARLALFPSHPPAGRIQPAGAEVAVDRTALPELLPRIDAGGVLDAAAKPIEVDDRCGCRNLPAQGNTPTLNKTSACSDGEVPLEPEGPVSGRGSGKPGTPAPGRQRARVASPGATGRPRPWRSPAVACPCSSAPRRD